MVHMPGHTIYRLILGLSFHLMLILSCRSDEQRSEKHKLKKEKEIEKEVMEAEREDDGGFSVKVKLKS